MTRRGFARLARFARFALFAAAAAACSADPPVPGGAVKASHPRGMVVLGIDGMDPVLTRGLLERGEMPNLAALIARGGFSELDTTFPPQSPVAWSTFITGQGSEDHGIYDFVHRDAVHLAPYLSTSRVHAPDHTIEIGSFALPLGSPSVELLRGGTAFWQTLEDRDVPATLVRVPGNFPPPGTTRAESMSGMGTPDMLGTYGTFQLVTDDPAVAARPYSGGIVHRADFAGGNRARAVLTGPMNPLSSAAEAMGLVLEVVRDPEHDVALVQLGDADLVLVPGEWSEWQTVTFDPGLFAGEVHGMVRVYLRQLRPTLHLYISPINLDPLDPPLPISAPLRYAIDLAGDVGRFYTQGMPEDTKALASGALSPAEFLEVVDRVMVETQAILERELDRFRGGLLFVYLSSIDQTSHVFFRSLDPDAPPDDRAHADVIPALYRRVDRWIGEVVARLGPDTPLVIMSDHGFAPFRTKVHLNTFLAQRGYLAVLSPEDRVPGPLGHIDWDRTQAYALGLNQVFVNLRDREARGTVSAAEHQVLLARLERDLLGLRDPATGVTAITRMDRPAEGAFAGRTPDLIVGYRRGYRSSDQSALGAIGDRVFEPNHDQWSGDHCMDPSAVPGLIAASIPIVTGDRPGLHDLAPTILDYFGIEPSAELDGRTILRWR
jgi:predicted AlkP superfamily phosphohydrolase/phosphomutase